MNLTALDSILINLVSQKFQFEDCSYFLECFKPLHELNKQRSYEKSMTFLLESFYAPPHSIPPCAVIGGSGDGHAHSSSAASSERHWDEEVVSADALWSVGCERVGQKTVLVSSTGRPVSGQTCTLTGSKTLTGSTCALDVRFEWHFWSFNNRNRQSCTLTHCSAIFDGNLIYLISSEWYKTWERNLKG